MRYVLIDISWCGVMNSYLFWLEGVITITEWIFVCMLDILDCCDGHLVPNIVISYIYLLFFFCPKDKFGGFGGHGWWQAGSKEGGFGGFKSLEIYWTKTINTRVHVA